MRFALLPAAFAAGALASALLLRGAPPDVRVDLMQPLVVATYWQQYGAAFAIVLLCALTVATLGYVWCLRARLRAVHATVLCLAACVFALLAPVVFSSDVYAYAGYGDMLLHGINPYVHARASTRDALMDAVLWQWGDPPPACVYGAGFLPIAAVAALALRLSAAAPLWILRILACCALALCGIFAGRRGRMLALNPLAIWSAAEGHNDIFALAAIFGGFVLARRHAFAGALISGAAGAIKAPAILALPAAWIKNSRGAAAGLAVTLVLSAPPAIALVSGIAPHGTYAPHFSPAFVFGTLGAIALAFAIALVGRFQFAPCAIALWWCIPNPYPWYGVWPIAAALFARRRAERVALIAAGMLAALRYYGEATSLLSPALETAIVAVAYGVPAVIIVAASIPRWSRGRRESRTADLGLAPGPIR